MKKLVFLFVAIILGCTPLSRQDSNRFTLLEESSIPAKNVFDFSICLFDGLDGAGGHSRQTRRQQMYRIDLTGMGSYGFAMLVSVDIFDDGRVKLYQSDEKSINNPLDARAVFKTCLTKYKN